MCHCDECGGAELPAEARTGLTEHDFRVQNEGTLVVLHPQNDYARAWIDEHLYGADGDGPEWWGGGVVIEHRFADDILQALNREGYVLAPR